MRRDLSRGFLLGAGAVSLAYLLRKPLKKAAVSLAGGLLTLGDRTRETYFNLKEEIEDVIAEAGYEHMKSKVDAEAEIPEKLENE